MAARSLVLAVTVGFFSLSMTAAGYGAEAGRRHAGNASDAARKYSYEQPYLTRQKVYGLERRDRFPRGSAWRPPRSREYQRNPAGGLIFRPDRHRPD